MNLLEYMNKINLYSRCLCYGDQKIVPIFLQPEMITGYTLFHSPFLFLDDDRDFQDSSHSKH